MDPADLTEHDQYELLRLLGILDARRARGCSLTDKVFNALLKLLPQLAVECVILRRSDDGSPKGRIEVFLTYRGKNAPCHQDTWHCPGSFLRSRETIADVMERLSTHELKTARIVHWRELRVQNNHLEPRGHTVSLVHLCTIEGEPTDGMWCDVTTLPENLVDHHHDIVMTTVQSFVTEPFLRHPSAQVGEGK